MDPALHDRHSKLFRFGVIAMFLVAICAPWADRFRPAEARSPLIAEKRRPTPLPAFAWEPDALRGFPRAFEKHFDDTFGFRDQFLRAHSIVKLFGLGVSPTPQVLVGEDGWLFFTGSRTIEDFRGLIPFTDDELRAWQAMYEDRHAYLARQGIRYLLVLVPNKEEMYPEFLPDWVRPLGERRIDQFVAHMRSESDVDVLDLRDAFRAARADEDLELPLYSRLGTHWNGPGQALAARTITSHLAETMDDVAPVPAPESLVRVVSKSNGDSWGHAMYIDDLLPQPFVRFFLHRGWGRVLEETGSNVGSIHSYAGPAPERARAMLLHDSFGSQLYPLMPYSFSELHSYFTESFALDVIAEVAPDVVIEERVQRYLVAGEPERLAERTDVISRFFLSDQRFLDLDLPRDAEDLEPVGFAEVETTQRQGRRGARLRATRPGDGVGLPPLRVPEQSQAVLRLEYWASSATNLTIAFASPDATGLGEGEGTAHPLQRGSGAIYAVVPGGTSRPLLRPARGNASVIVHRVDVR